MSSITVEVYSEKAIVVRNTAEHHGPVMQSLGGTFNDRLKGGRGWIFPKHMGTQLRNAVEKLNSGQYGNEFETPQKQSSGSGVSKEEYLSLLSRVERLEAIISNLGHPSPGTHSPKSMKSEPTPVSHTPISLSKPKRVYEVEIEEEEEPFEKKRLVPMKK